MRKKNNTTLIIETSLYKKGYEQGIIDGKTQIMEQLVDINRAMIVKKEGDKKYKIEILL
jgi:hypothetical protein